MTSVNSSTIVIYKDNIVCVAQVKRGYIKKDKTKHILSKFKFFYTYKLQENRQVDVEGEKLLGYNGISKC